MKLKVAAKAVLCRIDSTECSAYILSDEHDAAAWVAPAEARTRKVAADTIRALEAVEL
ncbi:MAG TPA: hypothetical protein VJP80_08040 [Candidatus Saccharimonadales bacterium]|nr:hypothetical protein [Candidatus Saccharimonadales bacterium]